MSDVAEKKETRGERELRRLRDGAAHVRLLPWEDDHAREVAEHRTIENLSKKNRISYDEARLMASNFHADIHAVVSEIGVARHLGAYWYGGRWNNSDHDLHSGLPDVMWGDTRVEVKWRRSAFVIPVDRKDVESNTLVIWAECYLAKSHECVCDFCEQFDTYTKSSKVRILGGGYAAELWELGYPYNDDAERMAVPIRHLTGIKEISGNHKNTRLLG